jgi:hypothetical protein
MEIREILSGIWRDPAPMVGNIQKCLLLLSSSSCFQHGKCLIKFQSEHTESYSFWSGFTLCVFVKEKTSLSSSIVWGFQLTIGLLHCLLLPAGYRLQSLELADTILVRMIIGATYMAIYLHSYFHRS